jgi:alpha-D-ribose 1-methylphosphonate 5-phosphate C-P lyase
MSATRAQASGGEPAGYNFAYLDEGTKRMIRRALLKAVAVPGYQVPFAAREMPMPYGWGTGGVQVTAAILGRSDVLKVIDQGADDTTNAVSIRRFFARTAGVATTTRTSEATVIQTRHRIPETALHEGQTLVFQVPIPEPLRFLEPRETETRQLHALAEYGLMHVKLYEDIARHGHIATTYAYPVEVAGRYVMDPSPTPKFDNPKMDDCPALQLFGAGREKRIYAVPPYTRVRSLDFEDHPFRVQTFDRPCALCGAEGVYLDEVVLDDRGGRMFVCSDTDHCEGRREQPSPSPATDSPSRAAASPSRARERPHLDRSLPQPHPEAPRRAAPQDEAGGGTCRSARVQTQAGKDGR